MSFMADFFVQFGANPTLGRLLGLMMCRDEPASLEELAAASGLSKASVSIHMRTLEQFEYCRKLPPGSDRRSYYALEKDFVATSYRRRLETQLRMLDRLDNVRDELAPDASSTVAADRETAGSEGRDGSGKAGSTSGGASRIDSTTAEAALRRLGELADFQRMAAESSRELLENWNRRRNE